MTVFWMPFDGAMSDDTVGLVRASESIVDMSSLAISHNVSLPSWSNYCLSSNSHVS